MGLFDRFKRKKDPEPAPQGPALSPTADTAAVILLGRDVGWEAVTGAVEDRFGPQALVSVDRSAPNAPAMTVRLEGTEFFCSYLAMPHPPQVYDLSSLQEGLFSPQEREELLAHRAFLVLAQKGGGVSLAEKRRVCLLFTHLAGALVGLDGAVGVFVADAELLISRRLYLQHAAILEKNRDDPEYFPAPLWISIRSGQKGELPMVGTWGLKHFGFLELWFLDAKSPWPELHEKLYLMSIFQITGRELYRNMDTIAFTPGAPSVFKELKGALFIVGGGV
ncbi:MAG: hypothetical protein HFF47_10375 [Lawsonibacter sp.]|nr:hypothetical protein [Lawsonibacter sp.]